MAYTPIRQRYVIPWSTQNAHFNAARNTGYFCDGNINATLPTSCLVGDVFAFANINGNFTILKDVTQTIRFGLVTPLTITSTEAFSGLYLICYEANTSFMVLPGPMGNFDFTI